MTVKILNLELGECSFCHEKPVQCIRLQHFKDPAVPDGKEQNLCRKCLEAIIQNGHTPFKNRRYQVRKQNLG